MGKMGFLWVILIAFLVLAPLGALAADNEAKVDVTVVDKNDDPIKAASVRLEEDNGNHTYRETTNADGVSRFTVFAESGTDYDIEVTKDGYEDGSDTVEVDKNDDVNVSITLRPLETKLTITVVDAKGDTVDSAKVTVESTDSNYDFEDTKETNNDGKATFNFESDTDIEIRVSKDGYVDKVTTMSIDFGDETAEKKITIDEEGEGSITLKFVNAGTGEIVAGVEVVLNIRDTGASVASATSGQDGKVFFADVKAPNCYVALAKKRGYADREVPGLCLNANDVIMNTAPLTKINTPPVAKAGDDKAALSGTPMVFDGSASSDDDGDKLTYTWTDSLGEGIPGGVSPTVTFTRIGTHEVTLTVSDGKASSTDTVLAEIDSIANCGNGICSNAENMLKTCPVDCPICEDDVCGVGENATCPIDCGIAVDIELVNSTPLGVGVNVSLVARDPSTGVELLGTAFAVIGPNGSQIDLVNDETGHQMFTIIDSGNYSITASKSLYLDGGVVIDIPSGFGGLFFWIFVIVVIVVVIFLAIRLRNTLFAGGGGTSLVKLGGGGKPGYKKMKFKKKKSTLESI